MSGESDSDYAFRLQMEEAISASLSFQSHTPQRPPSPPIMSTRSYAVVDGNSKGKGKVHETVETGRPAQLVGEGSSVNRKLDGNIMYRLYSKGLVNVEMIGNGNNNKEMLVGFGVAICDQSDKLLFELKEPLNDCGMNRQGAEIKALTRGLTEALNLGIKHITICCDSYPIFQLVTGKWKTKQNKTSMLLDELHHIRQKFQFSQPVLVAGKDVKFAYKLAREALASQLLPHEDPPHQAKTAPKEECVICYNDIETERMFSVDKCRHRYCFQCVKQHVEVKLLHGTVPKCPHDGCKSKLVFESCVNLLTPKLSELWKQRIKENAIPVTERVYCPYPKCSALMSKIKIAESAKSLLLFSPESGVRRCVECRDLFCVDCKVPWHATLSCTEYKTLHPNPPVDDLKLKSLANNKMWRQCGKCQHMIELKHGCNHITCRCGHEFCYNCGGGWNKLTGTCTKRCPTWDIAYIMPQDPPHFHVAPLPNNYFYDDDDDNVDDDDDDDDDDDEDFDYGYDDYPLNLGHHMNDVDNEEPFDPFPHEDDEDSDFGFDDNHHLSEHHMDDDDDDNPEESFDPFSDLPEDNKPFEVSHEDDEDDGNLHFGSDDNMLSTDSLQQLSHSDDDSDGMDDYPMNTHTAPVNSSSESEAEETNGGGLDSMESESDYNESSNDDANDDYGSGDYDDDSDSDYD